MKRTVGLVAFVVEAQRALDGLNHGRVAGFSAHYDAASGTGRVSVTTPAVAAMALHAVHAVALGEQPAGDGSVFDLSDAEASGAVESVADE